MKTGVRDLLLLVGDVAMILASFFVMLLVSFAQMTKDVIDSHTIPFATVGTVWIFIFFLFNLYETRSIKPTIPNLQTIGVASLVSMAASVILFYTIPAFGITPKTNLVIFGLVFVMLFILWRRIFYAIFAKYFKKGVAFVVNSSGDNKYLEELVQYFKNYPQSGFFVIGIYQNLTSLFNENKNSKIDTLIVSKGVLDGENLKLIYSRVENILSFSQAYEDTLGKVPVDSIDETWFLHNIRSGSSVIYGILTRVLNFIIALLLLILASPILLIAAILIKLDGGPIFYNKDRVGRGGKNFRLYKFRSMSTDADLGPEWTEKGDPRITRMGKILRPLHIDEVPQLLNVLRGDMALVGPRPEIPSFAKRLEDEIPHYNLRHIILPGFTGWAQIKWRNARGVAESKEKFEYDLYYIKNRNIFMDLGIILRTVIIIFTHDA